MRRQSKSAKLRRQSKGGLVVAVVCACALAVAMGAFAVVLLVKPSFAAGWIDLIGFSSDKSVLRSDSIREAGYGSEPGASETGFARLEDVMPTEAEEASWEEEKRKNSATPLIACCSGIDLHCSIAPGDLTGVLFHQASFGYALCLETELPDGDYDTAANARTIRVNRDQEATANDWLDADALHLWRTTDTTEMDTSIDIGALPGTDVRSPVSGTVVLVRDYMLYNEMPDIEIHIQPDGRPDLDCVLIHMTDASVKAGDRVEAGITPISRVRNIEEFLTDVQLGYFTPEGTGGNHVHVQVNDANYPGYRENRLAGAASV